MTYYDLDRQLRIEGWRQPAIDQARLGVIGDRPGLTAWFIAAAAALGIRQFSVIAPALDNRLIDMARRLCSCRINHLRGWYVSRLQNETLAGCDLIVDLSCYSLAKKLLLSTLDQPIVGIERGRIFCGRDPQKLQPLLAGRTLPAPEKDGPVENILYTGMALELVKETLFGRQPSLYLDYPVARLKRRRIRALQIGAGALGNFVSYLLAPMVDHLTIVDDDAIEATNLNRQVFFCQAVGDQKAKTLAGRIQVHHRLPPGRVVGKVQRFDASFPIADYDVVFDCVDNIEARSIMSDRCREYGIPLVHGGSSYRAGQAMYYDGTGITPADRFHFRETPAMKKERLLRDNSCLRQPDPSVIMSNMIVAGLMIDLFLKRQPRIVYYQNAGQYLMAVEAA